MTDETGWHRWGRFAAAGALAGVVTWFAFVANREVPILDWFDLGIHEVGHMAAMFAPRMVMFIAGSVAQVAVPLLLAWYFGIRRSDAAGGGFCLAWAGASAWDVSVYIADAPVQALPLIGGGEHDWAYLLGNRGWDMMHRSDEIAGFVEFAGGAAAATGIIIALWAMFSGLMRAPKQTRGTGGHVGTQVPVGQDPWAEAAKLPFRHESD